MMLFYRTLVEGYTSRTMQGPHHGMLPSSMKPPSRRPLPLDADDTIKPEQQKPKVPVLEEHLVGQLSKEEQDTLDAKFNEASVADKKVYPSLVLFQLSRAFMSYEL
jgi:epidermal growth factor receptor substrate 15